MTNDDRLRFLAALKPVARIYRETLDESFLEAWWSALEDMPIEALEDALLVILRGVRAVDDDRDRSFMPKPAEVRRLFAPALGVADVLQRLRWFKTQHCLGRPYAAALLEIDRLAIRALGGMEVICDLLEAERERFLVDRYLPEWLETARVRGWTLPPRDSIPAPPLVPLLESVPDATPKIPRLGEIGKRMPDVGDQRAKIARQAREILEGAQIERAAKVATTLARPELTEDEIAERKRQLAEQAATIRKKGNG